MERQKELAVQLIQERLSRTIETRTAWYAEVQRLLQEEDVYIWGTGQMGQWTAHLVHDMGGRVAAFIDNSAARWGATSEGILCISPEQLREKENPLVFIGVGMSGAAVAAQLADMNVRRVLDMPDFYLNTLFEDIHSAHAAELAARVAVCFDILADDASRDVLLAKLRGFLDFEPGFATQSYYGDICRSDQYFQNDLIHFTENSVLVDCGAYTGDTMQDFLRRRLPFRKYIHRIRKHERASGFSSHV